MAYGQQDYGMGAEYGYETEEERRRREEEERQREIEMMANTGMGAAAPAGSPASRSLGDIAGAYMNKRVDQAQQRVADVGEMFTDPQAALEKRLGMTGGAETEPTPVKQTITTDPTTGEQKMKIEGSVRDLSAANSLTPTVTGPAVPTAMPPAAAPQAAPQQATPQAQAQPMARPMPVPAQLPAAGPIDPNAPRPEIGQVPTPGPGVQVAGPATAVPPTTMAAAPAGGQTPAAVAAAPGASVAQIAQAAPAAAPAAPAEPAWVGAANAAGSDFGKLVDVAAKFPEARAAIQVKLQGVVEEQRKAQEAQRIVEAAQSGDPKAMNKLEQALRPTRGREREEVTTTDYLKAYMYARLGLNDLSAEVQAKIAGKNTKFGQMTLDGSKWSVERDTKTGEIIRAQDDEGNVATKNTINKLSAAGMAVTAATPPSATATRIRDSSGTEWSQVPTPQGMKFYDNEGKLGVPKGRTIPIAVGSDLEIAQARQDIETVAKFGTMTAQARLDAWANTNKLRADKGLNGKTLEEMGLNPDGSLIGEAVRRVGTPAMGAGQPATAPTPAAPVAPTAPVMGAPAPAVSRPVPAAPAAQPAPATGVQIPTPSAGAPARPPAGGGTVPTASQMMEQGKEDDLNRSLREASAKAKIHVAQNLEEQKNKVRTSMPANEGNVVRILTTLNDIATHPGLDKTVGLPRLLATPLEMIPRSDQREFAGKFKQLGGQEFLAAYNELRGGGGISEIEGAKAEQAISALKDTGISPAAFKQNMWILQDAVKTGFDRQRELVGQPPKYRESPDREAAKEWLRNNPNHSKAAGVRRTLAGF